jgi:hypothetical protein
MVCVGLSVYFQANAGDSRSVIGVKGEVKALSQDHKPTNDGIEMNSLLFNDIVSIAFCTAVEKTRIHGAGGYVEYGRVNGQPHAWIFSPYHMLNLTLRKPRIITSSRRL